MKTFAFLFIACIFGIIFEEGKAQQCGIGSAGAFYANYFEDKYGVVSRIIGGQSLSDGAFPWIVLLQITHVGDVGVCTGTVVSPNYILTAKHCTTIPGLVSIEVFYGSANRQKMTSQIYSGAFNSAGFNTFGEDIALIKLQTPIEFNENVNPICLSRNLRPSLGEKAIVAGFGHVFNRVISSLNAGDEANPTNMSVTIPNNLNAVKVDIIEDDNCVCHCTDPDNIAAGIKSEKEFCAGGLQAGTLGGDSGGPIMILEKNSNLWYQVGVTARGQTYATNDTSKIVDHGVYTDISKFCDWIEKTTNNEVTCES